MEIPSVMSAAAKSVLYFGYYLLGLGPILIFVPNILLELFGFPSTDEVWIRVVGVLVFLLGLYYARTAKTENQIFFRTTVLNRMLVMIFFSLFVVLNWAPIPLLLFGLIDVLGAVWTSRAMRMQ